jgi:transposase
MKNKKGRMELSYNPQITADHKMGIIVANDVCKEPMDNNQLKPQIEHVEENCGKLEDGTKVTVDNGYYNGENIHYLNSRKLDGYIPDQEWSQKAKGMKIEMHKFDKIKFRYDEIKDRYICPEGKFLVFQREELDKNKKKNFRLYKGTSCTTCHNNKHCTTRKDGIRFVKTYPFEKERREMAEKMQTKKAKEVYSERKEVVERIIGHYKENLGFRNFLTRSLDTVRNEFNLVCAAHNLKKIWILLQNKKIGKVIRIGWVVKLRLIFFRNLQL